MSTENEGTESAPTLPTFLSARVRDCSTGVEGTCIGIMVQLYGPVMLLVANASNPDGFWVAVVRCSIVPMPVAT